VDEDAAVLTCYLRERHRVGARYPGGELIDLYKRHSVAASVLLRSIEGYGPGQPPSGGRALLLSEDPPLAAVAVDARPRIDAVLGELTGLARPRLITLERARLLTGEIDPLWLVESSTEATKLTIYCGHGDSAYMVPAYQAACESLYRRGIAGATVLSGVDGTAGGLWHHAQFPRNGGDGPLMVVAVGSGERIATILPELGGLFRHPLMTVAAVRLCKRDGQLISRPETLPETGAAAEPAGMAPRQRLTLYTSEAARHDGRPVHRVIVRRLRSIGVSGATSQRGIWGFHGNHAPHGGHSPRHGRHVPVVTTVIDVPERIGAAFDVIDALTPSRGLVTVESVLVPEPAGIRTDHAS
jgi:PII-like signaling protein